MAATRIGTLMLWPDQPRMVRKREIELYGRAAQEVYKETVAGEQMVSAASLEALRKYSRQNLTAFARLALEKFLKFALRQDTAGAKAS